MAAQDRESSLVTPVTNSSCSGSSSSVMPEVQTAWPYRHKQGASLTFVR